MVDVPPGTAAWLYNATHLLADAESVRDDVGSAALRSALAVSQESRMMRDMLIQVSRDRAFVGGGSATVAAYAFLWAADAHEAGVADLAPAFADAVRGRVALLRYWHGFAVRALRESDGTVAACGHPLASAVPEVGSTADGACVESALLGGSCSADLSISVADRAAVRERAKCEFRVDLAACALYSYLLRSAVRTLAQVGPSFIPFVATLTADLAIFAAADSTITEAPCREQLIVLPGGS